MTSENGPLPGAIQQPVLLTEGAISSTVLGVTAWWIGSHTNPVTVRDLIARWFKYEDIFSAWAKLREACQLAAGQPVTAQTKQRSEVKLTEELAEEVSEVEKNGAVTLLIPSNELGLVRSLLDSNVGDERPVATRLESLEGMVRGVVDRLSRMEANQKVAARVPQPVNAGSQPVVGPQLVQVEQQQQQSFAGVVASGIPKQLQQLLGATNRTTRPRSVKRSVTGEVRDSTGYSADVAEEVFTEVQNKKKKKKEVSTGTATPGSIPGVSVPLQPSYQHFVGNTPGSLDRDSLEVVLKELALPVLEDMGVAGPLEIEQCNLLTKEENTRTRVWRVVVPHKYKAILQDDRMYPSGWHHREFEGIYRPPLSPEKRAELEAKRAARRQNDNRLDTLLRQLAGQPHQQ